MKKGIEVEFSAIRAKKSSDKFYLVSDGIRSKLFANRKEASDFYDARSKESTGAKVITFKTLDAHQAKIYRHKLSFK